MTRKRTRPKPSTDDVVKVCAKRVNISKKQLKKIVQEVKLRAVADRIVREEHALLSGTSQQGERASHTLQA